MRSIALDASHYLVDRPTGVELYVDKLLPELSEKLLTEGCEVTWLTHKKGVTAPEGVTVLHVPYRRGWGQRQVAKALRVLQPELYFTPSGIPPLSTSTPVACTVHDIEAYHHPEYYSVAARVRLKMLLPRVARKAVRLCVPTEFVKQDVLHFWKINQERVAITPLALTTKEAEPEPVDLTIRVPYALFVGRIERKKNLITVIRALEKYPHVGLVCAGGNGHGSAEIRAYVQRLSPTVQARIQFVGYVSEGQKRWLYERALCVVVPSLSEGFGLPVLEAFHFRRPVIASASGSLPEVAGSAALFVDGTDVFEWCRALETMATSKDITKELVSQGIARAELFTWSRCVDTTFQALTTINDL